MPVTGPGPRPLSTPTTTPADTAGATSGTGPTPSSTPDTGAAGWSGAGARSTRPLDLSLPPPNVSQADLDATRPNPAKLAMQANIDKYTAAIEVALNQDPMSIARGRTPVREGDPLTDAQQKALENATTDFFKGMPLGAISPQLASGLQDKLDAAGITGKDLQTTKLGDFGGVGGDIAKKLVDDFRKGSPAAFYSLAATAAAGIGYYGYSQGSAKLASLGIKPELQQKLFSDHLELKVGADWKAKFADPGATGTITAKTRVGEFGNLSASVSGNTRTGFDRARLDASYNNNNATLNANAFVTADTKGLEDVGGSVNYHPNPNLTLSATVDHNFQTERTTATGEATWKVNKDVDFALSASTDSRGTSAIGAGLRVRF
jgi:hypothetical protein